MTTKLNIQSLAASANKNLRTKTKRAFALLLMLALLAPAVAWAQSFGGGSGTAPPLSFDPDAGTLGLTVSLADQPEETWFAAFECENLSADPADWVAVAGGRKPTPEELAAGAIDLSVDASENSKFVKIVAADHPIDEGTKLSELEVQP